MSGVSFKCVDLWHKSFTCDTCYESHSDSILWNSDYGVALVSRIDTIIGLFCKRGLLTRRYSAKETYNFIDPTDRSHPIHVTSRTQYRLVNRPLLQKRPIILSILLTKASLHVPHTCNKSHSNRLICHICRLHVAWLILIACHTHNESHSNVLICDTIRFHVTWLCLCLCLCLCLSILWHNSFPCDMTHTMSMSVSMSVYSVTQFVSMRHAREGGKNERKRIVSQNTL